MTNVQPHQPVLLPSRLNPNNYKPWVRFQHFSFQTLRKNLVLVIRHWQIEQYGVAFTAVVYTVLAIAWHYPGLGMAMIPLISLGAAILIAWFVAQTNTAVRGHQSTIDTLKLALEATQLGIWDWDIVGDRITWSSRHHSLFGLDSGEFNGSCADFLAHIHPDDRQFMADSLAAAIAQTRNYSASHVDEVRDFGFSGMGFRRERQPNGNGELGIGKKVRSTSLRRESPYHQDCRILLPDRTIRWIALDAQLICDSAGQVVRMIGTTTDITEWKQAEITLHKQTERERLIILITQRLRRSLDLSDILNTTVAEVRSFLQADRVMVYRFNPDWTGTVVTESKPESWQSMAGVVLQDAYFGESYAQFYRQGGITAIADVNAAGLDSHYLNILTQLQVKSILILPISQSNILWGLLVVHQCAYSRHWEPSDVNLLRKLANQLAVAVHQSELHQQVQQLNSTLEQQVQERTAQLQQALDFEAVLKRITDKVRDSLDQSHILNTAVQELALALNVETCNAGLYNLDQKLSTICYEYPASTTTRRGLVVRMDEFPELYQALLIGQTIQYCPLISDSTPSKVVQLACPMLMHSELTQDNNKIWGDLWLTRSSDLSFNSQEIRLVQQVASQCAIALRQARLYEAAQAQVQELERLNGLKDDFLNTVSHELRTPMTNIKLAIHMLERVLKSLSILGESSKASYYLQILKGQTEREIQLINNVLDLSVLDAETEPLILTPINFNEWIPQVLEPFAERTQNQQQQLQIDIAPELPILETHSGYLERILTELVQNACKYTPAGETIRVTVTPTGKDIQLSVKNSGVEIAPNERDRIFDKFYRIPNNDPWKHGGTGLGLALVKRLLAQLGGAIEVESQFNQTTFTVQLPLR